MADSKTRKFRWWHACLIALGLFIGFIVIVFAGVFAGTSGAATEAEDFFARITAGEDLATVYEDTTQLFQDNTTLPEFASIIDYYPIFSEVESLSFSSREIEATDYGTAATMEGTVYGISGDSSPIEVQLVKGDDGEWRMTYFALLNE